MWRTAKLGADFTDRARTDAKNLSRGLTALLYSTLEFDLMANASHRGT